MTCPRCDGGGAVVSQERDGLTVSVCAACGWTGSSQRCEVRGCGDYASKRCAECARAVCTPHRASRKSQLCNTCFKRYRNVVKPRTRYGQKGSWDG